MKKMLKNNKGFTLVELLAVIVVLAVIILIAMPAVMSAMDKARKNALVTEVTEIGKIAQTAYADDSMGTGITSICYDLDYLVQHGYLDKKLNDYSGSVKLSIDDTNGNVSSEIMISNGIYAYGSFSEDGKSVNGYAAIKAVDADSLKAIPNVAKDCANAGTARKVCSEDKCYSCTSAQAALADCTPLN